jgi:membrane protease subunit HflC
MQWLSQLCGWFHQLNFLFVIAPWEQALRIRLGKTAAMLGPGLHFKVPFLDKVFVQGVRLRTINDGTQTITTQDGKSLTLSVVVSYAIEDISKLYLSLSRPEVTLLNTVQGTIAEVVSQTSSAELTTDKLRAQVIERMAVGDWGLGQFDVKVTNFVYVRALRLINEGYRTLTRADELDYV